MEFEQIYANLNDAQRSAVDCIDGPLLVIAGPGTGKTQLLSVRVANILRHSDVNPENILCLTFTDNGALNMRNRLINFIGSEAYKVPIYTYHAFGSYILQEHRPDLRYAIDDLDRFTIIRRIQSQLQPNDILRFDYLTNDIKQSISDFKSATLTPDQLREIAQRNRHDQAVILQAISAQITEIFGENYNSKRSPAKYGKLLETLKSFVDASPEAILPKVEPLAHVYYRTLAEILLADNGASPANQLRKWRLRHFRKDATGKWVFNVLPILRIESLANIMEQYQQTLESAGLFDYDDMILKAIDLLENDAEARYNAQERFQYILLDEFQDTNDAQAKLVSLLTDNPSNEGKPNIMAVGDDDQAIYGFQGANSSNFFDFDQKYQPKHVFLTENYRSSPEILQLAHAVIEQGVDRFCKAPNVNIDKTITASKPPEKTNIAIHEFKSYQAEYGFVAERIAKLLKQGVSGDKITVIAPKHKYLTSILPFLHQKDIRISYIKRENILDDPQIQSLLTACELCLALADSPKSADPYWFQILSLPCWKLTTAEIIHLLQTAKQNRHSIIEELLASEQSSFNKIADYFSGLSAKVHNFSAEYIISDISNQLFKDQDNYEYYSNLNTLRETLLNKDGRQSKKLRLADFVAMLQDYQNADIEILNKSPYRESPDAVVLQTVHSAKGLEYEHVFLIATDNKNWSDASGNRDRLSFPANLNHVRHAGDSLDEKLRVFFVAITRAKAQLTLSYSLSDFAGHQATRLKFLDIRETENGSFISHVTPADYNEIIIDQTESPELSQLSPDNWFDAYLPNDEVKRNLLLPKVERFRLSPTQLNCFVDLKYAGPDEFLRRYIINVPGESSPSLDYGNFVHEIMDEINKEQIDNDEAMARFHRLVDDADIEPAEKSKLHERGDAQLKQFLLERGDQLRQTHADSERSFFSENIVLDGIPLTGKIDRIEIDDTNKTIVVSDFKTGHTHEKWATDNSTFGYKIQLYFYKFLIENSREYRNYRVTKGRIDWIAPNDFGETVQLELDFKPAEATRIKKLIATVYHHIKTLDFPDTTDALKQSNPTKAFFDQLVAEK